MNTQFTIKIVANATLWNTEELQNWLNEFCDCASDWAKSGDPYARWYSDSSAHLTVEVHVYSTARPEQMVKTIENRILTTSRLTLGNPSVLGNSGMERMALALQDVREMPDSMFKELARRVCTMLNIPNRIWDHSGSPNEERYSCDSWVERLTARGLKVTEIKQAEVSAKAARLMRKKADLRARETRCLSDLHSVRFIHRQLHTLQHFYTLAQEVHEDMAELGEPASREYGELMGRIRQSLEHWAVAFKHGSSMKVEIDVDDPTMTYLVPTGGDNDDRNS